MRKYLSDKRFHVAGSLAGLLLWGAAGPAWAGPLSFNKSTAKSNTRAAPADPAETLQNEGRTVRVNFNEASWKTVMQDLSKQMGLQLLYEDRQIPSGRFTRRDKTLYTAADALKIVNRELELKGLRLVTKADHLILIENTATRGQYVRPVIEAAPDADDPTAGKMTEINPPPQRSRLQAEAGRAAVNGTSPRTSAQTIQPANAVSEIRGADNAVLQVNNTATAASIQMRHRRAQDVARTIYKAFGKRAQLVDRGPGGFPGMRAAFPQVVPSLVPGQLPQHLEIAIGIDTRKNELWLQGSPLAADGTQELIHRLDVPTARDQVSEVVVSRRGQAELKQLASNLPLQLALAQEKAENAPEQPEAPAQPEGQPADPTAALVNPGSGQDVLQKAITGLKGNVSVEVLPNGIMILTGPKEDVDAVMELIKEIERLSTASIPDVELRILQHANSETLSTLLTTVYERLAAASGRTPRAGGNQAQPGDARVSILPVVKPNAVLIIAAAADLESILKLIDVLDTPADPLDQFEVFPLKHAVADQVLTTINTFYEERTGLGPKITVVADSRTNSIIVHAGPRDIVEIGALIRKIDQGTSEVVSQMRIIKLKHALADELAAVITESLQAIINPAQQSRSASQGGQNQGGFNFFGGGNQAQGTGTGSAQLRAAKSAVVQFLSADGNADRLLKSGLVADIRITPDARINSLIVTAPEESMPLLEALIQHLDRTSDSVAEIKIFSLTNSDARSMVTLLEQLFNQASGNGQNAAQQAAQRLGLQVAGAEDANSGLIPLRFTVDTRTNSIIAVGSADALRVVNAILIRLDEGDIRQRRSVVFRLKNSPADRVAQAVNDFLTTRRELEQSAEGLVSDFEQIEREVIVVPETVSNTLLMSATPRFFEEIKQLITHLDEAPAQVTIQALLVEVTLDNVDEFGMELGLQDSVLFRRSVVDQISSINVTNTTPQGVQTTTQNVISKTAIPGFLFNNQQLGNNVGGVGVANGVNVNPGQVGKQGLTSFGLSRQNGDLGYGGLVLAAGSESVSVLIRALASNRKVDILSRPQIRTLDNQLGLIQVGQDVPVVNGVTIAATGLANPVVQQGSAGIILQVTPRISPDGRVVMEVIAERSEYLPNDQGVPIYTDVTSGQVIRAPRKDITQARAVVAVANEQTVVLGGMITRTDTNIQRKVPYLGDLPFLGIPFRYNFHQSLKRELLIFLTPRVVRTDAQSEYIKQIEVERIHFMEGEAERMHGPIMAVPAAVSDTRLTEPPIIEDNSVPTTRMDGRGPTVPVVVPEPVTDE